ncbi:hypothetical protein ACFLVH_02870 [Chloroflexota bacterium]
MPDSMVVYRPRHLAVLKKHQNCSKTAFEAPSIITLSPAYFMALFSCPTRPDGAVAGKGGYKLLS